MIKRILLILPIVASIFIVSCKEDDEDDYKKTYGVNTLKKPAIGPEADSAIITIYGDQETWKMVIVGEDKDTPMISFNKKEQVSEKTGKGKEEVIWVFSKANTTREIITDTVFVDRTSGEPQQDTVLIYIAPIKIKFVEKERVLAYYVPKNGEFTISFDSNVDRVEYEGVPAFINSQAFDKETGKITLGLVENSGNQIKKGSMTVTGFWDGPREKVEVTLDFVQDGITTFKSDSLALAAFQGGVNSTKLNWDLTTPVSTWEGVEVSLVQVYNDTINRVVALNLNGLELAGGLPTLEGLAYLRVAKFINNDFTGAIPDNYYTLMNLNTLWLAGNQLTGSLNSNVGNLLSMEDLRLYNNLFTGVIPASLGNLSLLQTLMLSENNFSGELPETIGYLKNLTDLQLNDNNLTVTKDNIPSSYKNNYNWFNWNAEKNIYPQKK